MNDEYDSEARLEGVASDLVLADYLPRGYMSVSQVSQYHRCGTAYEFRYIREIEVPRNSFLVQGSALHQASEKLHIAMMDSVQNPPLDFIKDAYADAHESFFEEDPDIVIMEEDISKGHIKDVGMHMVEIYYEGATGGLVDPKTEKPYRRIYPVAAERVIKATLTNEEGTKVPFMGVIDLEEPTSLADLKTKRKMGNQGEADNSLQMSLYAHVTGKPDVRLDQLIKPTKTLPPRYVRRESHRTFEEMAHAVDLTIQTAEQIAKGRFPMTLPDNWWCTKDWCNYWGLCRGRKR